MTKLGLIIEARDITYTTLATRARLQPRTVRSIATGETPLDNVAVGTIRRIASALEVPVSAILDDDGAWYPGDVAHTRQARLAAAVREVMWSREETRYPSPVEARERDPIADLTVDEFFDDMPLIDAQRG